MSVLLRIEAHQKAKQLIGSGEYTEALHELLHAVQNYGSHVGILCDMAVIYFMNGHMDACRATVDQISTELNSHQEVISAETASKVRVILGKMLEEQGQVSQALFHYAEAQKGLEFNSELGLKAQIQELRLLAWLEKLETLPQLYTKLMIASVVDADIRIELEHALLMTELQLFGVATAFERLQRLLQNPQLFPHDKKFFLTDFAELLLFRKDVSNDVNEFIQFHLQSLDESNLSSFEFLIRNIYLEPQKNILIGQVLEYEKSLSLLDLMRLLVLSLPHSPQEIRQRLLFLLRSLSKESQAALSKKWKLNQIQNQNYIPPLIIGKKSISFGDQSFDVSESSHIFKCLQLFSAKKNYEVAEFIEKIYELPVDLSLLERNRVALNRLNKTLEEMTGLQKMIKVSKNTIRFEQNVTIQSE